MLPHISHFEFEGPYSEGDTAGVACQAKKGDLPISISWYFDGKPMTPHKGVLTSMFGHRANFLSIPSVRPDHIGRYTCVATNPAGSASYAADLHVNGTLKIFNLIIGYFI